MSKRQAVREALAMTIVVAAEPLAAAHMQIVELADRIAPRLTPEYLAEAGEKVRQARAEAAAAEKEAA